MIPKDPSPDSLRDGNPLVPVDRDHSVRALFLLPLYRPHVGLIGTLAGGEAGAKKQGGEEERLFHR